MRNTIRKALVALAAVAMSAASSTAQEAAEFEGERTMETFQTNRENNFRYDAERFNGFNTVREIFKGKKYRREDSFINRIDIRVPENDTLVKVIQYYPEVKKGCFFYAKGSCGSFLESNKVFYDNAKFTKTDNTVEIDGYTFDIYRAAYDFDTTQVTYQYRMNVKTNRVDSIKFTNRAVNRIRGEYTVCSDKTHPEYKDNLPMIVPGVVGVIKKMETTTIAQTTNSEWWNSDLISTCSSYNIKTIAREVSDSEFEVPSDIELVDATKELRAVRKMIEKNKKKLRKKGVWQDVEITHDVIYDNFEEAWEY